jgi:opacity protein-like surface antigen
MKPSNRTLFVAASFCAAIFLTVSANGAENVLVALQQPPSDPCNWTGFYLGVNVGGSWNHFDASKQATAVDLAQQFYEMINGDESDGGGDGGGEEGEEGAFTTFHIPGHSETDAQTIGGGQTGFKFQFGHFVFGVEGMFDGNGSSVGSQHKEFQENELFLFTLSEFTTAETQFRNERQIETTWNGSVGGNIGFCWNRLLFFVSGGAAFTDVHFSSMDRADTSFFGFIGDGDGTTHPAIRRVSGGPAQGELFIGEIVSKKEHTSGDVLTGYYAGGGTMYQLTNLVSAGFEYRHVGYGDVNENLMGGNGPLFPGNGKVDLSSDQVLFKVNILVGPGLFGFGH